MADKRVIEQTASSEIYNDDWFLKDSVLNGTTKISAENLKELLTGDINDRADKLLRNIIGPTYEWSASKTYKAGAIVYYEDSLYFCIVDTATVGTFVPSEWRYTDLYENLTGKINSVIKMLAPYMQFSDISSIMPYSKGDIVRYQPTGTYKEKFYVAKEDLPEGIESYDPNDWDEYDTIGELIAGVIAEVRDNLTADGISYDNTTSGLEADDVQEAIDEVVTDIESVETALETKAEVDGFYDELYAGNLLSDNTETDNAPYLYRPSPSGKSCVDLSVVGGTVAWNQLVQNGNFVSVSAWSGYLASYTTNNNEAEITSTSDTGSIFQDFSIPSDHVVFYSAMLKCGTCEKMQLRYRGAIFTDATSNNYTKLSLINKSGGNNRFQITVYGENKVGYAKNAYFIDLTQAFGSIIADYVYMLESRMAGSGIEWLKSYGFLKNYYYAYQNGKLESVNVASRKVYGKNLVEETLSGMSIGNTGVIISATFDLQAFQVKEGVTYTITTNETYFVGGFFTEKPTLNSQSYNQSRVVEGAKTFVAPITGWAVFRTQQDYSTPQVEYGSARTNYVPYIAPTTYPLDSNLTLRGIPKLSNGNLYYDGDTYESDGSVKRKYGYLTLNGTQTIERVNWRPTENGVGWLYPYNLSKNKIVGSSNTPNMLADKISAISYNTIFEGNKGIAIFSGDSYGIALWVDNTSLTTETAINNYLSANPITVVFELATPNTESADSYENPQLVGSTEEFIDTRDVPIPVGGERKYYTDLKAKLEELAKIPDVPSTNGTYTLKATRSASGVTYSWVSG